MYKLLKYLPLFILNLLIFVSYAETNFNTPSPDQKPPQIDSRTCRMPEYPSASRQMNESGTVILKFLVGVNGKVKNSGIDTSSGFPRLDDAALVALSSCSFLPGSINGVPQESWAKIKYTWKLQSEHTIEELNALIQSGSQDSFNYIERAALLIQKGDTDSAMRDYSDAIRLDPKNIATYMYRARALVSVGKIDDAIKDLDMAISINSTNSEWPYFLRGLVLMSNGKYDLAMSDFLNANRANPNNYLSSVAYELSKYKKGQNAREN